MRPVPKPLGDPQTHQLPEGLALLSIVFAEEFSPLHEVALDKARMDLKGRWDLYPRRPNLFKANNNTCPPVALRAADLSDVYSKRFHLLPDSLGEAGERVLGCREGRHVLDRDLSREEEKDLSSAEKVWIYSTGMDIHIHVQRCHFACDLGSAPMEAPPCNPRSYTALRLKAPDPPCQQSSRP